MWYPCLSMCVCDVDMPACSQTVRERDYFVSNGMIKTFDAKKHLLIICGQCPPSNSLFSASSYYRGYYRARAPRQWLPGSCRPRAQCTSSTRACCSPRTTTAVPQSETLRRALASLACSPSQSSWAAMARHSPRLTRVSSCPRSGYHNHTSRSSDGRCLLGSVPTWARCRWCGLCLWSTCPRLPGLASAPDKSANSQCSTCYRVPGCTRRHASARQRLLNALSYWSIRSYRGCTFRYKIERSRVSWAKPWGVGNLSPARRDEGRISSSRWAAACQCTY